MLISRLCPNAASTCRVGMSGIAGTATRSASAWRPAEMAPDVTSSTCIPSTDARRETWSARLAITSVSSPPSALPPASTLVPAFTTMRR